MLDLAPFPQSAMARLFAPLDPRSAYVEDLSLENQEKAAQLQLCLVADCYGPTESLHLVREAYDFKRPNYNYAFFSNYLPTM